MTSRIRTWIAPALLIVIGCAQMVGDLLDIRAIKAVGAATGASPAPKVFTAHQGFETYSSHFFLRWIDKATGQVKSLRLTPAVYGGVRGPYNRRNAYGAVLSYAPVLQSDPATQSMHDKAIAYAMCGPSGLLEELSIDRAALIGPIMVELMPRQKLAPDHNWKLRYEVSCDAQ
jgi:hypothetical protein